MVETPGDSFAEACDGECAVLKSICGDFAEKRLELGEELLDGIKVGAIGGEVNRNCTASLDGFFDSIDFMNADVVHEHDVASLQGRSEKLFRIGLEHLAGHRSFEHERRSDTIMTQRSDEGDGFPIAVRQLLDQSLALRRPPVETGNRRGDTRFIDKNKALRIKPWLLLLQGLACGGDVRPVLLGGPYTFF